MAPMVAGRPPSRRRRQYGRAYGAKPRLLIIDDDRAIRTWLRRLLKAAGYQTRDSGLDSGLQSIIEPDFDLVILDLDSRTGGRAPDLRAVREVYSVPILALASNEDAAVAALDHGADDYIRKPFSIRELLARTKNALRRRAQEEGKPAQILIGDIEIDLLGRSISSRGQEIRLPVRLYEVLRVLAEAAGKVVPHQEILCAVWGAHRSDRLQHLRVAIQELRHRLEADPAHPRYILTEIGVGYRLKVERRSDPRGRAMLQTSKQSC
jgi:two-component system, OmpR family, KDP operon response regulator KdpE